MMHRLLVMLMAKSGVITFTPLSLFSNGEQGAWYNPSDLTTMFQDSAGTTPVTAVEQPMGLILDKSGRGNHATQTTATKRPVLSARVNLLTKTEVFSDAAWSKNNFLAFGSGSVVNATTAPDGTLTADLLIPTTTAAAEHYVDVAPLTAIVSGASYTISWCGKASGYKWLRLAFNASTFPAAERAAWFDVEAGVKGTTQANVTSTIEALPNGFYRCSITRAATSSATVAAGFAMITNADQGVAFTANGTSGMYWWGASLVHADQASLPYQRVDTATDYDTVGFPEFTNYDTVDDVLNTTFASALGSSCTVARAVVGQPPVILTNQTIGTSYATTTDNAGLLIINRALTPAETASLTTYLTAKGAA